MNASTSEREAMKNKIALFLTQVEKGLLEYEELYIVPGAKFNIYAVGRMLDEGLEMNTLESEHLTPASKTLENWNVALERLKTLSTDILPVETQTLSALQRRVKKCMFRLTILRLVEYELEESDYNLRDGSSFTNADKDACLPVVDVLLKYARVARTEGLLIMEEYDDGRDNVFLDYLLDKLCDGVCPITLNRITTAFIKSEGFTGRILLEHLLIAEGCYIIQAGGSSRDVETRLLSYLDK